MLHGAAGGLACTVRSRCVSAAGVRVCACSAVRDHNLKQLVKQVTIYIHTLSPPPPRVASTTVAPSPEAPRLSPWRRHSFVVIQQWSTPQAVMLTQRGSESCCLPQAGLARPSCHKKPQKARWQARVNGVWTRRRTTQPATRDPEHATRRGATRAPWCRQAEALGVQALKQLRQRLPTDGVNRSGWMCVGNTGRASVLFPERCVALQAA